MLQIVLYPHPTLRRPSKAVRRVDAGLRSMVREMFELMYQHKGVGLAANQVDLPYRLFVMNPEGDRDAADAELVLINPVLSHPKGVDEAEEGCLSIPGVYAQVKRPERIHVNAFTLTGEEIHWDVDGLFARIVQHETDHLDGVLFIEHLNPVSLASLREELEEFETDFASKQQRGELPSHEEIAARLAHLEELRT
jgi:peptide deformylase